MKTKLPIKILFTFAFFLFTFAALAEIRYVSKTGSSVPPYTTWTTASDSIQKCINICNDGDTVIVANGVYKEFLTIDSAITLLGTSMDSTVIDGRGLGTHWTVYTNNHFKISGFKIIGRGISESIENTVISTNSFKNLQVKNCLILNANNGIYFGQSSDTVQNVIIKEVDTGIFNFCGYDTCKPKIHENIIIINEHPDYPDLDGIVNFNGGQPRISNNIILASRNVGDGVQQTSPILKININGNLISGFARNISASKVNDSIFIVNNILREQNSPYSFYGSLDSPGNRSFIRNNILSQNKIAVYLENGQPNMDYNLYWDNEIHATNGSAFGEHDVFADPMFVKDTIARSLAYDYHLQTYSPAIDAGDKLIQDVDGSRSDIGMFGGPGGTSYIYLNLPPKPPVNFHAVYDSNKIIINWDKFSEADFSHYNIYRSVVNNFIPDSNNYYCSSDSSYFIDEPPLIKDKIYYKITSVDSAGNESIPGEQIVINITEAGETFVEIAGEYKLYQNYPNPFNPVTIIPYRLKERAYVKVMVYDIKGELIEVLVNEVKNAGYYETEFSGAGLASGIYLYRIEIINDRYIPVYMDMHKMILLK